MRYDVSLSLLVVGLVGCSSNPEGGDPPMMGIPDGGGPGPVVDCGPEGARLTFQRALDLPGLGMGLAFSPDGKGLGIGGHFRDPNSSLRYDTKLYDVQSGQLSKTLDCHNYWAITVAWGKSVLGEIVANGSFGHAVQVWNALGPGSTRCEGSPPPPSLATLKADGVIQVLGEINGAVTAISISPDGNYLYAANRDPTVRVWQLMPGPNQYKVVGLWFEDPAGNYLSMDLSPDGKRVVIGDSGYGRVAVFPFDTAADLWDDATIADFATLDFSQQASWFNRNMPKVTRMPLWAQPGHTRVETVKFSPDGKLVAAAADDGKVWLFDAQDGTLLRSMVPPRNTDFAGLDFRPDGRYIAAGAADNNVYIFETATGTLVDTLTGHNDEVTAVAWSRLDCTLATTAGGPRINPVNHPNSTGPDQTARIWNYR